MIQITQIAGDPTNIIVDIDKNRTTRPTNFIAEELPENVIRIIATDRQLSDITLNGVDMDNFQINDTYFESATEAVEVFNKFGNFNSDTEIPSLIPTIEIRVSNFSLFIKINEDLPKNTYIGFFRYRGKPRFNFDGRDLLGSNARAHGRYVLLGNYSEQFLTSNYEKGIWHFIATLEDLFTQVGTITNDKNVFGGNKYFKKGQLKVGGERIINGKQYFYCSVQIGVGLIQPRLTEKPVRGLIFDGGYSMGVLTTFKLSTRPYIDKNKVLLRISEMKGGGCAPYSITGAIRLSSAQHHRNNPVELHTASPTPFF